MSKIEFLQVEGHTSLVRDVKSNAIVNTNVSEYDIYMSRHRARNEQSDQIRNACKEINNLKAELREIKGLIGKLVNGS
tara:strand:- start:112 stop:345 length:234 start_codon:yes stop_codon:yes gene_type:complete